MVFTKITMDKERFFDVMFYFHFCLKGTAIFDVFNLFPRKKCSGTRKKFISI